MEGPGKGSIMKRHALAELRRIDTEDKGQGYSLADPNMIDLIPISGCLLQRKRVNSMSSHRMKSSCSSSFTDR